MIENYPKCCQCKQPKKKENILNYYTKNCKLYICKNCFGKNKNINLQFIKDNTSENDSNLSKFKIVPKSEDKKLDLKEFIKKKEESSLLNTKRRITKKIKFKRNKTKKNIDIFVNLINKVMYISAEKNKLLITSQKKENLKKIICNLCKKREIQNTKSMLKFITLNSFINFFDEVYKNLFNEEYNKLLINNFKKKYNQIVEEQKNYLFWKSTNKNIFSKTYGNVCFLCLKDSLIMKNGINKLYDKLFTEEEKKEKQNLEVLCGFENILINTCKNNGNTFNENQIKEENKESEKNNSLAEDLNMILNDKTGGNIFDLILGDEEGDINDLENNSDENKTKNNNINNGNECQKDLKKDKLKIKGKSKDNKITFTKIVEFNNPPIIDSNIDKMNNLNNSNFVNNNNNNINNSNNSLGVNSKNKNINIINMNNINNINQFNESNYIKKNTEQIPSMFYNMNYIPSSQFNQNPSLYRTDIINNMNNSSTINNNNINNMSNTGFLNNSFVTNEELIYERLNNQLMSLKNKLVLMSNLNSSRISNNTNLVNDLKIFISNNYFKENLFYFQNSMHLILNYMNDISDILDKYSSINDNSLTLINSMIRSSITSENVIQLKNNSNHFSQILNFNYNIQKMNKQLCDIINKHINHS